MSNINTAVISGNLTREPELRHANSGTAICNIGVAVNRSVKDGDEWKDEPSFFDVTVFGRRGELLAEKFSTGDGVVVKGRLEQQRWEAEDGSKRSKVVIIAETVEGQSFFKKSEGTATAAATPEAASDQPQLPADDDIPF